MYLLGQYTLCMYTVLSHRQHRFLPRGARQRQSADCTNLGKVNGADRRGFGIATTKSPVREGLKHRGNQGKDG